MSSKYADRNLLFGVIALQMDFVSRDALVAAMHAWTVDKSKSLGQILCDRGDLAPDALALLDALVDKHLALHDNDPAHSLAAFSSGTPTPADVFEAIDPEIAASIAPLKAANSQDATQTFFDASPMRVRAASTVMRYRILRPHKKGGLGEVYVAEDTELRREVALKEIQMRHAHNSSCRERFVMEAEITGGLEHPGIVPVYGLGSYQDGRPFYAMRFIKGSNFKEAIDEFHAAEKPGRDPGERALSFRALLNRFVAVCQAVAYAHNRGVLHRDLKPSNIMLGKYGETLLVDWGMAKSVGRQCSQSKNGMAGQTVEPTLKPSSGSSVETIAGQAIGTPPFMSPEQAGGKTDELGPATDIYSLGATLYSLLTGEPPFNGETATIIRAVQLGQFRPPHAIKSNVPPALEAICLKAMALKPTERYASAAELASEIEQWLADEPIKAWREPWSQRAWRWLRRHRTMVTAGGVLLTTAAIALAISNALILQEQRRTEQQRRAAVTAREKADLERVRAEENLALARASTMNLLTIAEQDLRKVPNAFSTRARIFNLALSDFRQFLNQRPDDRQLQELTARILRFAANANRAVNKNEIAIHNFQEAVALYEKVISADPNNANRHDDLAETLRDMSQVLSVIGRNADAKTALLRSIEIAQSLQQSHPDASAFRRTEAISQIDLSGVCVTVGNYEEGKRAADKAVETLRQLAKVPVPNQTVHDSTLLGMALNRLAECLRELGQLEHAMAVHADSVSQHQSRAQLPTADNNDRHFYGRSLVELARTIVKQNPKSLSEAKANYTSAIAIWTDLVAKSPQFGPYRSCYGVALTERAQLCIDEKDFAAAEADLSIARKELERLVELSKDRTEHWCELTKTYLVLGRLSKGRENVGQAKQWFDKADAAVKSAIQRGPGEAMGQRLQVEIANEIARITSSPE